MKLKDTGRRTWGRKIYRVEETVHYVYDCLPLHMDVYIPSKFETDLASIPWPLHRILPPDGPWKYAAVVHDRLCESDCSRFLTDAVFRHKMEQDGVRCRVMLYYAVRLYWVCLGKWKYLFRYRQ